MRLSTLSIPTLIELDSTLTGFALAGFASTGVLIASCTDDSIGCTASEDFGTVGLGSCKLSRLGSGPEGITKRSPLVSVACTLELDCASSDWLLLVLGASAMIGVMDNSHSSSTHSNTSSTSSILQLVMSSICQDT